MLGYFQVSSDTGAIMSAKAWLFAVLSQLPFSAVNASLLFALLFNALMFLFAWVLWRSKIFIKV